MHQYIKPYDFFSWLSFLLSVANIIILWYLHPGHTHADVVGYHAPWKSKVKVMVEVKVENHKVGVTSYRLTFLYSMSIGHPIPEIQHFQNLTMKIQGQGHGWRRHWKSQHGCHILSTHIPLIPCQSAIIFLRYDFFKIWPWKSKVKIMGEGNAKSHKVGVTSYRLTSLSLHVNWPFHSWDTAFSKFDLENPRSKSNDHDVAQLQV